MATGEIPHEPAVHGSEKQLPLLGATAKVRCAVEQPADLRSREIRGERQPATVAKAILSVLGGELAAQRIGAGVLPDDRVANGLAGMRIPHDSRLALVCDTDRDEVAHLEAALVERTAHHLDDVAQDFAWIVFDPPGAGKDLLVLLLAQGDDASLLIKHEAARRRRSLVDRGNVSIAHEAVLLRE
jgi:hypothetical protein